MIKFVERLQLAINKRSNQRDQNTDLLRDIYCNRK